MHDQLGVGVGHRVADSRQQLDPRTHVQGLCAREIGERGAGHVLHRVPRPAVGGEATIEEARDVRMIEPGEDAPLLHEAAHDLVAVHAALEQLERNLLHEAAVAALGEIHLAHAAATEQALQLERADGVAGRCAGRGFGRLRAEAIDHGRRHRAHAVVEHAAAAVGGEQALDFGGEFRVLAMQLRDPRRARRIVEIQHLVEQLAGAAKAGGIMTHRTPRDSAWGRRLRLRKWSGNPRGVYRAQSALLQRRLCRSALCAR